MTNKMKYVAAAFAVGLVAFATTDRANTAVCTLFSQSTVDCEIAQLRREASRAGVQTPLSDSEKKEFEAFLAE